MKIIAFAGSNSSRSINHQFIQYIANNITNHDVEVIRLTDYDIPLYSIDIEKEEFPNEVLRLHSKIREADGIIISVAEHNGNVSAFFKSIIDWMSRYDREFLKDKKWLLLSTAPGKRGGASALAISKKMLDYFQGELIGTYSLNRFKTSLIDGKIVDKNTRFEIQNLIDKFTKSIN